MFQCSACQRAYCSQQCFEETEHPKLCAILQKYGHMREWTWNKQGKGNAEFVAFRKEFVDALVQHALDKEDCKHQCTASAVGSQSLTSDYDVTVSGPRAANVVDLFNREFRKFFNDQESATVFDTNVYGAGFLEPIQLGNFTQYGKFKYVADAGDVAQQRKWALLKVYPERGEQPKTLRERNLVYVDALYAVQKLKARMKETSRADYDLRREYKESISRANYYGSETYYTQGAFMHVVGQRQSKMTDIPITRDEYVDSFIENVGDALRKHGDVKYVARALDALIKADRADAFVRTLYEAAEKMRTHVRGKPVCGEQTAQCVLPSEERAIRAAYQKALGDKSIEAILKELLIKIQP